MTISAISQNANGHFTPLDTFTIMKPRKHGPGKTEERKKTNFTVLHCRYCDESKLAADQ